jgi:thiosulfate reductase cytochrome b subunit
MAKAERRGGRKKIHPLGLRVMHWLNAFAIVMMIGSGWQIYDGSPLFNFTFPALITIGGWLGAGIAWHLAFIWLLMGNGLVYLVWGFSSGHFRRKLWPISPRAVLGDLGRAFTFRLGHQKGVYNAVQKLLYAGVIFAGVAVVVSGLGIWKPVQLWFFTDLCGGYFVARYVHFFAMACIVAFSLVHVALVVMVPKVLPSMITGGTLPEVNS